MYLKVELGQPLSQIRIESPELGQYRLPTMPVLFAILNFAARTQATLRTQPRHSRARGFSNPPFDAGKVLLTIHL
jgi:hypothetical protein